MENSHLIGEKHLRSMFDAFPFPVFIMDRNLAVQDYNRASKRLFGNNIGTRLRHLCGELLSCVHANNSPGGCGKSQFCSECVIREITEAIFNGESSFKRIANMVIERENKAYDICLLVSGSPMQYGEKDYVILAMEDITELTELRKIVSVCSHCHKIKDDSGGWYRFEDYFAKYLNLRFSHGVCKECMKKEYPEMELE